VKKAFDIGFDAYLDGVSSADLKHVAREEWSAEDRADMIRGWMEAKRLDAVTAPSAA
jgi:hypothetical protein